MEERNKRNECYSCKHRREVFYSAHSSCAKPDESMKGEQHGVNSGWFIYPVNFDPVWKRSDCKNFKDNSVSSSVSQSVSVAE